MPKVFRYILIFCGFILSFFLFILFWHLMHKGISLPGDQKNFMYSSCYSVSEGKVYYNKPYRGYFLVKGADATTFKPLNILSDNGLMGKDANHVYFKTEQISSLKPAETTYLGNNYCKDNSQVFYGDRLLKKADPATMKLISGYYGADKAHLYFKGKIIKEADLSTLRQIKYDQGRDQMTWDYLCDKNYVYFKGTVIKGANPESFTRLYVEDDQWNTQYSFDGKNYFYEDQIILVDKVESKTKLNLLSLDKTFAWFGLFYQDKSIYFYDTDRRELVLMGTRAHNSPFTKINRGIFADGKHIYFTFNYSTWVDHDRGHTTGIDIAAGASPADFKAVGNFDGQQGQEGIIYQSGSQRYFHQLYTSTSDRNTGLRLLGLDGTVEDLPKTMETRKFFKNPEQMNNISFKDFIKIFKEDDPD